MGISEQFKKVESILTELKPAMQADGGGVDLVSIKDGCIFIKLKGTCLACPSSNLTIKYGIEATLKKQLPWVVEVIRVE